MEVFTGTKSRNAVIKRMIEIGLIAERAEILQKNRRKSKATTEQYFEGDDDDDEDHDVDHDDDEHSDRDERPIKIVNWRKNSPKNTIHTKAARINSPKFALNIIKVRESMKELTDDLRENLEWICESLNDAAEDADDCSEDPDDGVPLVPFSSKQRDALEVETFQKFLLALGLQAPAQNTVNCAFYGLCI